jgi:hypothetical protein
MLLKVICKISIQEVFFYPTDGNNMKSLKYLFYTLATLSVSLNRIGLILFLKMCRKTSNDCLNVWGIQTQLIIYLWVTFDHSRIEQQICH